VSEPCRHERDADAARQSLADCTSLASAVIERLTTERDGLLATIERVQAVLIHCHADTCATELSPHAGYDCTCWRGDLKAALEPSS